MKSSEFLSEAHLTDPKDQPKSAAKMKPKHRQPQMFEDEQLTELDWKKAVATGATAAAMLGGGAMPSDAQAAPWGHKQYTDQMTGQSTGTVSTVKSDDGKATLSFRWGTNELWIEIPRQTIHFTHPKTTGRIKAAKMGVTDINFLRASSGDYSTAFIDYNDYGGMSAMNHIWAQGAGELKIEVPIYREGNRVFTFTLEPDNISKSLTANKNKQSRVNEK